MKYANYILLISFIWINVTCNKDMMDLRDTLKISIHASDEDLTSGFVNYGDGTVINFSKLNKKFDTTLAHIFKTIDPDSDYIRITVGFRDNNYSGDNIYSVKSKKIFITKLYYSLPLSVGMLSLGSPRAS